MALSYVKKLGSGGSGTSTTLSFNASAAGTGTGTYAIAVLIFSSNSGLTPTVSDAKGNSYTVTEIGQGFYIAVAKEATQIASGDAFTITMGGGTVERAEAVECSGFTNGNPTVDQVAATATTLTNTPTTPSVTPTTSDEIALTGFENSSTTVTKTYTPGTGWTEDDEGTVSHTVGSTTTSYDVEFQHKVLTSTAAVNGSATASGSALHHAAIATIYDKASAPLVIDLTGAEGSATADGASSTPLIVCTDTAAAATADGAAPDVAEVLNTAPTGAATADGAAPPVS